MICLPSAPWDDRDEVAPDWSPCCIGSSFRGPTGCTCWVREYDPPKTDHRLIRRAAPTRVAPEMCHDCAYRPDSPERTLESRKLDLERIARADGEGVFWCHQGGMRRVVAMVHPDGRRYEPEADSYDPPIREGRPYLPDGRPAQICAGFAARRRAAGLPEKPRNIR